MMLGQEGGLMQILVGVGLMDLTVFISKIRVIFNRAMLRIEQQQESY